MVWIPEHNQDNSSGRALQFRDDVCDTRYAKNRHWGRGHLGEAM
jgi:hypothetical protein